MQVQPKPERHRTNQFATLILYSVIYFQHYIRVLMYIKISILIVQAGPAHTGLN